MPQPWRPLPETITRRWASAAVVEALGEQDLAKAFFAGSGAMLGGNEKRSFRAVLRSRPEPGGPATKFVGDLLTTEAVHRRKPPKVPAFRNAESVVNVARVADHAGALYVAGSAREQPRGSVDHYLSAFGALAMLTMAPYPPEMAPDPPEVFPPTQRLGGGRKGRPAPLDVRATLRILVGLVKRCRPEQGPVTPAVGVALMLWMEGHRRPRQRDPNRPWPFKTPPSRFALRREDGSYREDDILPVVEETERWVVTGASIRRLAKAIQNVIASKDGEYQEYVKPRRVSAKRVRTPGAGKAPPKRPAPRPRAR
jgi:hypothetical protein